jgi:hypothetical protein
LPSKQVIRVESDQCRQWRPSWLTSSQLNSWLTSYLWSKVLGVPGEIIYRITGSPIRRVWGWTLKNYSNYSLKKEQNWMHWCPPVILHLGGRGRRTWSLRPDWAT